MKAEATKQQWAFDPVHSSISFTVRHMVVSKVRGLFGKWDGTLAMDERDPAGGSVAVTIDAASINTGVDQRDGHLRSPDFLDVERFPTITFRSTRVEKAGTGELKVTGDLTIHGVARSIVLDVEYAGSTKDPWGGVRAGFSGRATLDRKEFGLTYNQLLETGGVLVGENVEVAIEAEMVKQVVAQPVAA